MCHILELVLRLFLISWLSGSTHMLGGWPCKSSMTRAQRTCLWCTPPVGTQQAARTRALTLHFLPVRVQLGQPEAHSHHMLGPIGCCRYGTAIIGTYESRLAGALAGALCTVPMTKTKYDGGCCSYATCAAWYKGYHGFQANYWCAPDLQSRGRDL